MAKTKKLPKRIAGVKIPKKVRKRGAPLYDLMTQPMVRTVAADVLAAGLLAAADALAKSGPAKKAGKKAKRAAAEAGETTARAATSGAIDVSNVLAFAAREAAKAIKKR
ncbi:MAG TPA: hypothetical protein VJ775_05550 [Sphingomicrobium sp.]|nr:hypothetical protein [Sphingomicrobium sp.]